jgi:hypothetical protein
MPLLERLLEHGMRFEMRVYTRIPVRTNGRFSIQVLLVGDS